MAVESILNKIKSKLEGLSSIQQVADWPTDTFNGYPAAMIVFDRMEAEFETTAENKRVYSFTIYLLQELESQGERQARRIIRGVVDDVTTLFDEDQLLSGIELLSYETMVICLPTLPNRIYVGGVGGGNAQYVVAEMEIRVFVSVNVV